MLDENYTSFIVDLKRKTCGYEAYHINGIPCKYIMSGNVIRCKDAVNYVDYKLSVSLYMATHAKTIHLLPSMST